MKGLYALGILAVLTLFGCGGSSAKSTVENPDTTRTAKVPIRWENPTREVVGPPSALSATIRIIRDGKPDRVQTMERPAAGGTAVYDVANVEMGTSLFTLDFYAGPNATGTRMRRADGIITVDSEGVTVPTVSGAPDDTVHHVGFVLPPFEVLVGTDAVIRPAAYDKDNALIALPDTRVWSVTSGSTSNLTAGAPPSADGDWTVRGVASGDVTITASLDGKSIARKIRVYAGLAKVRFANASFESATSIQILNSNQPAIPEVKFGKESEVLTFSAPGFHSVYAAVDGGSVDGAGTAWGFQPNGAHTVILFLNGLRRFTDSFTIDDTFPGSSETHAIFANLSGNERKINVYVNPAGTTVANANLSPSNLIVTNLPFRLSASVPMPSGPRKLWLADADSKKLITGGEWDPTVGKHAVIVAIGTGDGHRLLNFYRND